MSLLLGKPELNGAVKKFLESANLWSFQAAINPVFFTKSPSVYDTMAPPKLLALMSFSMIDTL